MKNYLVGKVNPVHEVLVPIMYWPRGYRTFFMLNSAEHEIYPAHKC